MYIGGTIETFESRLHQLAETQSDLNSFVSEGNSLFSVSPSYLVEKWNRELAKKQMLLGEYGYFINPPINGQVGIQGVGGDSIFGVGGEAIEPVG